MRINDSRGIPAYLMTVPEHSRETSDVGAVVSERY